MEKQMMIRCPKCGAELPLDADVYNSIADQVQKQVVADAVSVKEKELLERMASQVALAKSQSVRQLPSASVAVSSRYGFGEDSERASLGVRVSRERFNIGIFS